MLAPSKFENYRPIFSGKNNHSRKKHAQFARLAIVGLNDNNIKISEKEPQLKVRGFLYFFDVFV